MYQTGRRLATFSLAKETGIRSPELRVSVEELLGRPVDSLRHVGGGRNSRLYRVTCADSAHYALKLYFRDADDGRDRLGVEFSSLSFLWDNGARCTPRPIAADREHLYGVYEYIDGDRISDVSPRDIDHAVEFVQLLKKLSSAAGSVALPAASEACFSAEAAFQVILSRLDRLLGVKGKDSEYLSLKEFLREDFIPLFEEIRENLRTTYPSLMDELGFEERVLSPSDFGFHNSLRRKNGEIIYLDLEYFGWDDPAKMISDFLLHPAVELDFKLKQRFFTGALRCLSNPALYDRVQALYPVYGLNWCLILLNEFIHQELQRRKFAGSLKCSSSDTRTRQLAKSRKMFSAVRRGYEEFPYRAE
jgi:hypothetical protein